MSQEIAAAHLDLTRWIRPGDTVAWSHATGEPRTLTEALVAQRHAIGRFRVFLGTCFAKTLRPEHADAMDFFGMGAVGFNRDFCKAGVLDVMPCHLSDVPELAARGLLRVDVMLVHLAQGADGRLSYGVANAYVSSLVRHARVVIAEVNTQMPWTCAATPVDPLDIDVLVRSDRPVVELPGREPTANDRAIAQHIVPLVPDGAVLQVGIGTLPNAVLAELGGHRDLGIHSGVIGDNVLTDLILRGVVTNATKPVDRGVSVTGALFGTRRLYDYAHANPALRVESVEYTNDLRTVAGFDAFVTINSALEVDLTGQVNGESAGREYLGTIGGQTDFIRGALASPHGRSIVALPSVTEKSGVSRITVQLGTGVTTTARADADVFVTEHGVAQLRGRTIRERVRAMIAIAHPSHRETLEREARERVAGYA